MRWFFSEMCRPNDYVLILTGRLFIVVGDHRDRAGDGLWKHHSGTENGHRGFRTPSI